MDPTLVSLDANAAQLISDNSAIPSDITFKFPSVGGEISEVSAHKTILAMVSDIFTNMFFVHDTVDMSAKVVVIEDSNKPTFQMMLDAIYNVKPMKESLQGKTVHEIFAVFYLVTKYKISSLELAVKEHLSSFPFTVDNVIEVANDAQEYAATFDEAVQILLLAGAKFLKSNFVDKDSFVGIVANNGNHMEAVHKLAVLMKDLPTPPCRGCKRKAAECLDGVEVTAGNFKMGVKVRRNPDSFPSYRPNESQGVGVVVREDESTENRFVIRWENNEENGNWPLLPNASLFLFKCR